MLFFKFAEAGMWVRSVFRKLLRPSEIINLAVGEGFREEPTKFYK